MSPGVLLSSGYIAGGTILAIVVNLISAAKPDLSARMDVGKAWLGPLADNPGFAVAAFGALVVTLLFIGSRKSS